MENRKSHICIEDISQRTWREFAKKHGIEPMLDLVEKFGGAMVYIRVITQS
jgi:hypothetical protein|tara:strand:+ start:425 stop:577 length:153 start_codon:yes stop_codon:yes gene_type:complete